ncbi:sugar ABC transporter ATP-binding protein, partial [Neisseria gonorrhoeae]
PPFNISENLFLTGQTDIRSRK